MISRSIRILAHPLIRSRSNVKALQPCRNNSWVYRQLPPKGDRWEYLTADTLNAFMWWWIFVHMWYQWGHVAGEYDYPDTQAWSDSELGVVDIDE